VGLPLDPSARAGDLSVALKQRLEIVKALATDARILLLDEPTAVLAPGEADDLLRVVRAFTAQGGTAVLITHKLDEALAAADRVTVLREGAVVFHGAVAGQMAVELAGAMIGEPGQGEHWPPSVRSGHALREASPERGERAQGDSEAQDSRTVLVRLEELEIARDGGYGIAVRRATLSIRAGETVGVAAVEGNGQRELLRAVAGRLLPLRGRREVAGPVGFIPEDRTTEGLIPEFTLTENVVLGSRTDDPWLRHGRIDWRVARARTVSMLESFGVVAPGPDAPAAVLSGGNQQKVVAARELTRDPRVVVAENPTRGLDIRAAEAIHERLRAAADGGAAVLVHSSDLDEVLALGDRILVAARGTLIEVPRDTTRAKIGELMVTGGR
jgi:simple sugar transport system ATP-binding protein